MGADDWSQLTAVLNVHMGNVRRVFNELIGDDETETREESLSEQWRELWQDALQEDDTTPVLAHLAEDDQRRVLTLIADFRKELDKRTIGPRGRRVLDHLMPHLLSDVCSRADASVPLSRITPLLVGIVTRTTYLELLSEFPGALKHLISLCAASPMVASQLARYPLLLDELLDRTPCISPPQPMPTVMSYVSICCVCRRMTKNSNWKRCVSSSKLNCCVLRRPISPGRCQ